MIRIESNLPLKLNHVIFWCWSRFFEDGSKVKIVRASILTEVSYFHSCCKGYTGTVFIHRTNIRIFQPGFPKHVLKSGIANSLLKIPRWWLFRNCWTNPILTNQYEVPRLCESKDSLSALITDVSCRRFGLKSGSLKDWYIRLCFILTISFLVLSIAVHNTANIIKRHIRTLQVLYVQYVLVIITTVIRKSDKQGSLDASNFHVTSHAWRYRRQKIKTSWALIRLALRNLSEGKLATGARRWCCDYSWWQSLSDSCHHLLMLQQKRHRRKHLILTITKVNISRSFLKGEI